jgi:hypothetical protein
MSNDEQEDPDSAMERFEDLARKVLSKTKDDLNKAEERAEEIVDEALGPPPAKGPALGDDKDRASYAHALIDRCGTWSPRRVLFREVSP